MFASSTITDTRVQMRVARQTALLIVGLTMLKRHMGLPPAHIPADQVDTQLLTGAKGALEATGVPDSDIWQVIEHPTHYATVRAFLSPEAPL